MLDSIKGILASRKDKTHLDISKFILLAPTSNGCVSNRDNKIIKAAVFEFIDPKNDPKLNLRITDQYDTIR